MPTTRHASSRAVFTATAILSSGWAVSLLVGLVSAKATAVLMGPIGVGYIGLLQSTLGLAVMMGGVYAGVIPAIARARAMSEPVAEAASRSAAWGLWLVSGGSLAIALITFRVPLARLVLGTAERADAIAPLAVALLLTLAAGLQAGILTAHQRIREIAWLGVSNSVLGPVLLLPLLWIWRESAVPWALCAGSFASFLVSRYYLRRTPPPDVRVSRQQIADAARGLLRFGLPFNASALAGTGVQLTIPFLILHTLGSSDVGFYRASIGISMAYLGSIASAMGQDYYPRVSACGDDPAALASVVNDQARLVLRLTGPVILGILAFAPYLVPLIYTSQFAPVVPLLEWQLVADLLRVTALALGFALLGRNGALSYLGAELLTGGTLLLLTWIGMGAFQLNGVGIASLVSSAAGLLIYASILYRTLGVRLAKETWFLLMAFLVGAVIIRAAAYTGVAELRVGVGLAVAGTAALATIRAVRAELGGLRRLLPWRSAA